jgi:tetratricopeptide (TPR) repeat protein
MSAGRQHVKSESWDEAARNFSEVLDQLPKGFRASSEPMSLCVEIVREPEVVTRLVSLRPRDWRIWNARGRIFASARQWTNACDDLAKALELLKAESELSPSLEVGPQRGIAALAHGLAAQHLLAADETGYQEFLATILRTTDNFSDPHALHMLSRACSLSGEPMSDPSIPIRLAERAVALGRDNAWFLYGLGAAHYRAGQHGKAIARLEKSLQVHPTWLGRGQNYLVLAMACHQLGRSDEARKWLDQGNAALTELEERFDTEHGFADTDYMSDWLTMLVLVPQAKECLQTPAVSRSSAG